VLSMTNSFSLGIIVPVYNTKNDLPRCIDSLIHQTYTDIKVILVDDGSDDGSGEICDEYGNNFENIAVIHQGNRGAYVARKKGVESCDCEYIGFCDSDDWVEADFYEKLMSVFNSGSNVDVGIGGYIIENEDGMINHVLDSSPAMLFTGDSALYEMFKGSMFNWSLCDKIYSRYAIWDVIRNLNLSNSYGEDTIVNSRILHNAGKVSFLPAYGYHYCMRSSSMTHQSFSTEKVAYFDIYAELIDKYKDIRPDVCRWIEKDMVDHFFSIFCEINNCDAELSARSKCCSNLIRHMHYYQPDAYRLRWLNEWSRPLEACKAAQQSRLSELKKLIRNHHKNHLQCYLYGAGNIGKKVAEYLLKNGLEFDGFVVTSVSDATSAMLFGKKVLSIKDIDKRSMLVLSMGKTNTVEVKNDLEHTAFTVIDFRDYFYFE